MEIKEIRGIERKIEAILFACGHEVSTRELAVALDLDEKLAGLIVLGLRDKYDNEERGICIVKVGDSFQMASRKCYHDTVSKVVGPKSIQNLSNAAFEVLSIICYNQPCSKAFIDYIRGVDSGGALSRLVERELVCEVGRSTSVGKALLYGTTSEFLRAFGLSSLSDLPDNPPMDTDGDSE